jgi:DNA-binding FadR family transcriptional regulator
MPDHVLRNGLIERVSQMDDRLIHAQETAIRASCAQLSAPQLQALRHSVARACQLPRSGWGRKATAHAEIFSLLAGAADDPVLIHALSSGAGLAQHLMVTVGPAVSGMTASSRQRFLMCLCAGDPGGAAREMESHLRVLSFMGQCVSG